MTPLAITALSNVNARGTGLAATAEALRADRGALSPNDYEDARIDTHIGRVDRVEDVRLPAELARFDCRNNRLAETAIRADGFEAAAAERLIAAGLVDAAMVGGADSLCHQEDRVMAHDNTVTFHRLCLQIPQSPRRPHYVRARVQVRCYPNFLTGKQDSANCDPKFRDLSLIVGITELPARPILSDTAPTDA